MTILVCQLKLLFQVQAEEEILEKNLINCEKENKKLQEKCGLYKSDLEILKEKLRYSILLQKKDFWVEMKKKTETFPKSVLYIVIVALNNVERQAS